MAKDQLHKIYSEYRLEYDGKTNPSVILAQTPTAPLQEIRLFNEHNPQENSDWKNMLIFGDNLLALKHLYDDIKGENRLGLKNKIKLIYIDPPFATKQDFMKDKEKAYSDKLKGAQFIEFLRQRLILLREILAVDGSIYVHLDQKKGHYIKTVLDEVFGEENFKNEIIWKRTSAHSDAGKYGINVDCVYFFTKNEKYIWNQQYENYSSEYLKRFRNFDSDGRKWQDGPITAKGLSGGGYTYSYKGIDGYWRCPLSTMEKLDAENKLHFTKNGGIRVKRYFDESKGIPFQTVWTDIFPTNSQAAERLHYPTQKPEELLERLFKTSSNEGDIILDCFAGSGTAAGVAEKLKRKWIAIDAGKLSVYTMQTRLLNLNTIIGNERKDSRLQLERISEKEEIVDESKGLFMISEKAKKGQFDLTDDFLERLHQLLLLTKGLDEFSLVCPEAKFHLSNAEEDEETGLRYVKKDHITYKISFIEPRQKGEKPQPLTAKTFGLYHVGVYDYEKLLQSNWETYRRFVMKLYNVHEEAHAIGNAQMQGYMSKGEPVYIWDYPDNKDKVINEATLSAFVDILRGRQASVIHYIVPMAALRYFGSEYVKGKTTLIIHQVPNSVFWHLRERNNVSVEDKLGSLRQPKNEKDVNNNIDSFGYDFMKSPLVEYSTYKRVHTEGMFEEEEYVIDIKTFKPDGLYYSPDDFENFEKLSLILVDFNFKKEAPTDAMPVFTIDKYYWGDDLKETEEHTKAIIFKEKEHFKKGKDTPEEEKGKWTDETIALILIDEFGNEKTITLKKNDFE